MELQLEDLVVLNIFVGKRSLEPLPNLAATDLNGQVEDVFTVLKFIFSTQRNFELLIYLFRIYYYMHTD